MTDKEIREAVLRELEWEPLVKSTELASLRDGISLSGYVDSYTKYNRRAASACMV
jgi:hypothetical protein